MPLIFTNARHSREGGNPEDIEQIRALDSRLRGNDACFNWSTARRQLVLAGAGLAVSTWVCPALAQTDQMAAAVSTYATGQKVTPGKVKLDIAELVENGNVVPMTVSVDSPMTAANHVKTIAVFNEKNPQREVVKFTLGPRYGKASVSTRIRLATTQKLVAVAQLSDGTYWSHTVEVIVTLAACIES